MDIIIPRATTENKISTLKTVANQHRAPKTQIVKEKNRSARHYKNEKRASKDTSKKVKR